MDYEQIQPLEAEIENLRKDLTETDWYVVRYAETGKPIPEEILLARQEKRQKINDFTPITLTNYDPFQMTSIFNAGYKTGGVQIGFEHSCFHPMQPYATIIGNEIKPKYEGGYNKIFMRFSN